jgi:hypothetical protein
MISQRCEPPLKSQLGPHSKANGGPIELHNQEPLQEHQKLKRDFKKSLKTASILENTF